MEQFKFCKNFTLKSPLLHNFSIYRIILFKCTKQKVDIYTFNKSNFPDKEQRCVKFPFSFPQSSTFLRIKRVAALAIANLKLLNFLDWIIL